MGNKGIMAMTAKKTPPRALVPALIGLLLVLVAAISFMIGRATAPAGTTSAAVGADGGAVAGSAENPADPQAQAAKPQQQPDRAEPISDPKTLELAKQLPRRVEGDPLALGPVDAPVLMTMWADYACPQCTDFELTKFDTIRKYADEGKIRIEWRDFAIFVNPYKSDLAARGGRAAANQGKFWEYVRAAYQTAGHGNHPTYTDQLVLDIAKTAGVPDLDKFQADYADPATAKAVQDDTDYAQSIGLGGTPAFLIGDAFVGGNYPLQYFLNTIEDRLAAA